MAVQVLTYITYDCEDAQGITMEDFQKLTEAEKIDMFYSFEEYVWQEAETKSEAIWRHDDAFQEWHEDVKSGYNGPRKFY